MSGQYPPGPGSRPGAGGVGQRIEEAIELIEFELRHAITYVNDAVIPQVRKESITAMRAAADTLHNLADRFERRVNQAGSQAGSQPSQSNPANSSQAGNDPLQNNPPRNNPWGPSC